MGYIADVVLVNGDPSDDIHLLADTQNSVLVMRDGQVFVEKLGLAAHLAREAVPA